MKIELARSAGFCYGVRRAVAMAEQAAAEGRPCAMLGPVIHNRSVTDYLRSLGVGLIQSPEEAAPGTAVIIRSHGEGRAVHQRLAQLGCPVIDATCPVVAHLQKVVVEAHRKMQECGGQVVILGKRGHAEVVGLTGQVESRAIVIERGDDLGLIDFTRPIHFLAQTTQSIELFEALGVEMRRRAADPGQVHIEDTICRQVSGREEHLTEFAGRFGVVLFVCGRKSSNGKVLSEVCRRANPRTHVVEEAAEIDPEWIAGAESVGICGATSTPKWLMQEVAEAVARISGTHKDNQSQQIRP